MVAGLSSNGLKQFLQSTATLWWSGSIYVSLTACFLVVMWVWDFQIIDELFLRQEILNAVASLDRAQRHVHILVTATLDVIYPFTYGIFQSGMAYRYLGRWGELLAPLSLMCIPVDLLEGFSQVMILTGQNEFVDLKVVVTPIKLFLYIPGLCAALVAIYLAVFARKTD